MTSTPAPTILEALHEPLLEHRIRACRRARGLTQGQLSEAIGLSRLWVTNIEHGRGRPSLDTFFELARVLDVDPVTLYHGAQP